jgi:CheY-like chemotaxis protein
MPGASGWEVAEKIAAESVGARAIVMVPIPARGTQAPSVAAVVTKPLCRRELWQALGIEATRQETATSHATHSSPNPTVEQTERRQERLRILLAEDNPVNQLFARRLLEKNGYRVTLATDGEAALRALERDTFDIVLMDVQMPVMDGLEAARRVRERERETGSHIPIIAMTAHAMTGDRDICLKTGMDG